MGSLNQIMEQTHGFPTGFQEAQSSWEVIQGWGTQWSGLPATPHPPGQQKQHLFDVLYMLGFWVEFHFFESKYRGRKVENQCLENHGFTLS